MNAALVELQEASEKLSQVHLKVMQEIDSLNLTKAQRAIVLREMGSADNSVGMCVKLIQKRNAG